MAVCVALKDKGNTNHVQVGTAQANIGVRSGMRPYITDDYLSSIVVLSDPIDFTTEAILLLKHQATVTQSVYFEPYKFSFIQFLLFIG